MYRFKKKICQKETVRKQLSNRGGNRNRQSKKQVEPESKIPNGKEGGEGGEEDSR